MRTRIPRAQRSIPNRALWTALAAAFLLPLASAPAQQDDPTPPPAMASPKWTTAKVNAPKLLVDDEGFAFGTSSFSLEEKLGGEVAAVAISPDGKTVVTAGSAGGAPGFLKLWDADGKALAHLRQPKAIVAVAFSPDGKLLATAEADGVLKLRDPATGRVLRELVRDDQGVYRVLFSPDGKLLVTLRQGGAVGVWDVASGKAAKAGVGPRNNIAALTFSRDGKTLVSCGNDGTLKLWDWSTGKERRAIKSPKMNSAQSVAISPDGKTVAAVDFSQPIHLFSTETGKEITPTPAPDGGGFGIYINRSYAAVAFTPDGKSLAASRTDNRVVLLDPKTLDEKGTLGGEPGFDLVPPPAPAPAYQPGVWVAPLNTRHKLVFSPDGKRLATSHGDRSAELWDPATRREVAKLPSIAPGSRAREPVLALAATRDGKTLALALENKTVALCESATGEVLHRLKGHGDKVTCLAFSPDGKTLVSGSADNTVKVWDCATGKERRTFEGHGNWVYAVAFSPDGKTVASGAYDRLVMLWDAATGREHAVLRGHTGAVRSLAFAPDGKTLASGGSDRTVRLWDVATATERGTWKSHKAAVRALAFSRDGKILASGDDAGTTVSWDVATGKAQRTFARDGNSVAAVAFPPAGTRLAIAMLDGLVSLWDPSSGNSRGILSGGHQDGVTGVVFSADGRRILTAGYDRTVRAWPGVTVPVRLFQGHKGTVHGAVFSPNGRQVLSCGADGTVRLVDFATGKEVQRFEGAGQPVAVAFSPDGERVLTAGRDKILRLYRVGAIHPVRQFRGHEKAITAVAFSPDGRLAASAGRDHTVWIWEVDSGKFRHVCQGHTGPVRTVAFAPDGRRLLSGGRDQTLRIWNVETGEQVGLAKCVGSVESALFLPGGEQTLSVEGHSLVVRAAKDGKRVRELTGHTARVDRVVLVAGGKTALTVSHDGTARTWDLAAGKEAARVSLTPQMAAGAAPGPYPPPGIGTMMQKEAVEPEPPPAVEAKDLKRLPPQPPPFGGKGPPPGAVEEAARSVSVSPDGRYFLVAGSQSLGYSPGPSGQLDLSAVIRVWRVPVPDRTGGEKSVTP